MLQPKEEVLVKSSEELVIRALLMLMERHDPDNCSHNLKVDYWRKNCRSHFSRMNTWDWLQIRVYPEKGEKVTFFWRREEKTLAKERTEYYLDKYKKSHKRNVYVALSEEDFSTILSIFGLIGLITE